MLTPRRLRRLTLDPSAHPRGQPHLSSASGLVRIGRWLYVVADDEHHLAQLDAMDPAHAPLRLIRLAGGVLAHDASERKRAKPDLETLVAFPAIDGGRALLAAWGSGSRPQRERAFVFNVDEEGGLASSPREVSLGPLYRPLQSRFGELNIEAGYVGGPHLHLFQRAHGGQPLNGHVVLDAGAVRAWLAGTTDEPPAPATIATLDLGRIDGVPLGITDAAAWPAGGFVFTAVAEDTTDAYNDGACVGSMIGWAGDDGRVTRCEALAGAPKVEGICVNGDCLWLVTDADDPGRASELLEVRSQG
jgi:hypothetical protein